MKKAMTYMTVFLLGGGLYCTLEVLWRGYTHWSMALVGGLCVVLIYCVEGLRFTTFWKMVLCGIGITLIEGVSGVFLNLIWKLGVWDYSDLYLNLFGQVCLWFAMLWMLLSYPAMKLISFLNRHIFT